MSSLEVCLNAVIPIILMMALGLLARRLGALDREDVPKINRIAFRYFMPLMLFYNVYSSDIKNTVDPKLLIFAAVCVLTEYFISLAYVLIMEKAPEKRGVKIQGLYRSNFVIIGLPLASALVEGSDLGGVVLLITVVVPMFNVLAVITLEMFNGRKPGLGRLLLDIAKNPLILGTVCGLFFLFTGIKLPHAVEETVRQIGAATNPLLLFLLGAFFRFDGFKERLGDIAQVAVGRLVIFPAVFLTAAMLIGVRGIEFAGMIAIFGSATAIASFTMAQQMGGDAELAGNIVVATSALCPFTMFCWALLFKTLGVF